MKDFSTLGLPQQLEDSLKRMKFATPTPIQAKAIPIALKGRDILGSAQTGTGKTAAFGIPLIERLLTSEKTTALVMTPTRELATQVQKALLEMLGHGTGIKSALLIGGDSMYRQLNQLKGRPRLIVGTPGRITDHLERRSVHLRDCGFLVLDETDRMLDMGFGVQIDRILKHMPKERQTLLFSATLPPYIIEIAKKYLHMPERIAVGDVHSPIENIKQEMVKLNAAEKYKALSEHLSRREGSVIVFVKTKHGADRMATKLQRDGHKAEAIHGDLKQSKRDRVIADFRDKEYRILVATDVAARGLDIPHIEHVINYDLPQVAEDYIHRIGRTARAGKTGEAVIFVTPEDGVKWKAIYHLMNPSDKSIKNSERADTKLVKKPSGKKPFARGGKEAFGDGFKKGGFKKDGFKKDGYKKPAFKDDRYKQDGDKPRRRDERSDDRQGRSDYNDPFSRFDRFERDGKRDGGGEDRPRRSAEGRSAPRRNSDSPRRDGDAPRRNDDRPRYNDDRRPARPRAGEGDSRPRSRDGDSYARPRTGGEDRPPRRRDDEGGYRAKPRSEGDRAAPRREDSRSAPRSEGGRRDDGKPARSGAAKKFAGKKSFGGKPSGGNFASGDRPRARPAGGANAGGKRRKA
ncbi:MAG: DEAD/DEAH box helicase [Alphaproteobacteria bacterium]|nr:DEAD/DEAH box helicase [Alphaproteobacteria bacterium]